MLARMPSARTKLLVQILAALGVSTVACGKEAIVAPDNAEGAIKECPDAKGHYAVWPDDKQAGRHDSVNDVCLPKPADGKCSSYTGKCVLSRFQCGLSTGGETVLDTMPSSNPEACCWKVKGGCAIGRPFVVAGAVRIAPLARGPSWSEIALTLSLPEDAQTRAALADVWARDGLTEHASVASFAQLVLDLLSLGAPADLVRGAQEAMGDEIRHAERAFALASLYAGARLAPGPLDTCGAATRPDLADFAARTASEACIAETIAALQLHAAADAASDPTLAALLRVTAEEETVHALLGYRIVRWAIAEGGAPVRSAALDAFAAAATHVGFGPLADDALDLRAHGVLSRRERHDLAVAALRDVIAPAGRALPPLTAPRA